MRSFKVATGIALVLSMAILVGSFTKMVSANKNEEEKKVTICHRGNNAKQPYGPKAIEVNKSAADGGGDKGDHFSEDNETLVTSEEEAKERKANKEKWGDIIPPIEGKHAGLNWTAEGQAIWENDCQFVEENGNGDGNGGENGNGEENGEQGEVLGTTTAQAPQVAAPIGGVEAGAGGAAGSAMIPLTGLGSSLSALGYGIYRLRRQ